MDDMESLPQPELRTFGSEFFVRLVPSRYPPIQVFETIYDTDEERDMAFELEALTNDRLRDELGEIQLVPPNERISGPGASVVMAAFTHIHNPSRFTDGSYGVYYAGDSLETAIAETAFHRARFLAATNEPDQEITMREYLCTVCEPLHDLHGKAFEDLFDPDPTNYGRPQRFGATLRSAASWGVYYPSVRREQGSCIGLFRPKAITPPKQGRHLRYVYQSRTRRIKDVFQVSDL